MTFLVVYIIIMKQCFFVCLRVSVCDTQYPLVLHISSLNVACGVACSRGLFVDIYFLRSSSRLFDSLGPHI